MRFKEKDEIVNNIEFKFHNKKVIQKKKKKGRYIDCFEKLYLRIGIKSIHVGVWAKFINKINEKIEFELGNSHKKLKIRLSEEDKTVSSRNLKI